MARQYSHLSVSLSAAPAGTFAFPTATVVENGAFVVELETCGCGLDEGCGFESWQEKTRCFGQNMFEQY